jgi:hypothetical protein
MEIKMLSWERGNPKQMQTIPLSSVLPDSSTDLVVKKPNAGDQLKIMFHGYRDQVIFS